MLSAVVTLSAFSVINKESDGRAVISVTFQGRQTHLTDPTDETEHQKIRKF